MPFHCFRHPNMINHVINKMRLCVSSVKIHSSCPVGHFFPSISKVHTLSSAETLRQVLVLKKMVIGRSTSF